MSVSVSVNRIRIWVRIWVRDGCWISFATDAKADSDYDFCIIVDDCVRPLDVKLRLYAHIAKQYACDLLVFRKAEFEEGSKFSGLVQYSIAREGLKTYVRSATWDRHCVAKKRFVRSRASVKEWAWLHRKRHTLLSRSAMRREISQSRIYCQRDRV